MSHPNGPTTGRPATFAPRGIVSTPHYPASASGLEALRRGSSAVDAAIAANSTLSVVYPHMGGFGADGFWLIAGPALGELFRIARRARRRREIRSISHLRISSVSLNR